MCFYQFIPCSRPVTMPSSSLPAASLSTPFSLPAGRPGGSVSSYLKYMILSSIIRWFSGRDSRFLPALREARVGDHLSCPRVALPAASAPAIAGDRSAQLPLCFKPAHHDAVEGVRVLDIG